MNLAAMLMIVVLGADPLPLPKPVTIGSTCPRLPLLTFVRGKTVDALLPGTVYVLEFSGTSCVPCIKNIPHVNELQKKHPQVVFFSVYCEEETVVREFLKGPGSNIEIAVAADPRGQMSSAWSAPACQDAIPHVFIVSKEGTIAWIGHPEEMSEPLAAIVAGKFDPEGDIVRLHVQQQAVLRQRRRMAREEQGQAE